MSEVEQLSLAQWEGAFTSDRALPDHLYDQDIIWSEDLVLGLDVLDRDHKVLVCMIRCLLGDCDMPTQYGFDQITIHGLFTHLLSFTQFHLQREEALMAHANYPNYLRHQQEHQLIMREVQNIASSYHKHPDPAIIQTLGQKFRVWLFGHILGDDRSFVNHVKHSGLDPKTFPPSPVQAPHFARNLDLIP
ncbi:bacteriohemerythrin [Magnetococcus sp. PR-3]|uniref:bacteriohemerythrin n=1 Tax=Magnetococcus sp. PR-3 TaxID=3120355 RepID=UPI002FCE2CE7